MSSFKKRFSKNNLKWFVTYLLISVLAIGLIFAFAKISDSEETKTLKSNIFTYSIGCIDDEGKFDKDDSSICLRDFYLVEDVVIEIDDKAEVTYKMFFYDEDEKFIRCTNDLSSDYDSSITPATAKYFKLVIIPVEDSDVSVFEIGSYASQLTITVNK